MNLFASSSPRLIFMKRLLLVLIAWSLLSAIHASESGAGSFAQQSNPNSKDAQVCDGESEIDLLLMVDESGSMRKEKKSETVATALKEIRTELFRASENINVRVALASFRGVPGDPARATFSPDPLTEKEISTVTDKFYPNLELTGDEYTNGTNYLAAFERAIEIFESSSADNCRVLVFFTDGVIDEVDANGKTVAEATAAQGQRDRTCGPGGLASDMADEGITTFAVVLKSGTATTAYNTPKDASDKAQASLEMLLAITGENPDDSGLDVLMEDFEARSFELGNSSCEKDYSGQIITADDVSELVNSLLIPVFKVTYLEWPDCPEYDSSGTLSTSSLPSGVFIESIKIQILDGKLIGAVAAGKGLGPSPSNPTSMLSMDAQELKDLESGWSLSLTVRSSTEQAPTLKCWVLPAELASLDGDVLNSGQVINAIDKTRDGLYKPSSVDLSVELPSSLSKDCQTLKGTITSSGESGSCSSEALLFTNIGIDSLVGDDGKNIKDLTVCFEPEFGENLFYSNCETNSLDWPRSEVSFDTSIFQEGVVGVDCKDPELEVDNGAFVSVSCNLNESDEAGKTRFDIQWNGKNADPWFFVTDEGASTSVEITRPPGPSNPYEIRAQFDGALSGILCVVPSEIRGENINRIDLGEDGCQTIDFFNVAEEKLGNLIECSQSVLEIGSAGEEVPEGPLNVQTPCEILQAGDTNITVDVSLSPAQTDFGEQKVDWSTSITNGSCQNSARSNSQFGQICLQTLDELPNIKYDKKAIEFSLNAKLVIGSETIVSGLEDPIKLNVIIDYNKRSNIWAGIFFGVILCILMAALAYAIWASAMKKSARLGSLAGLAYTSFDFEASTEKLNENSKIRLNVNELDKWVIDPGKDIGFPQVTNGNRTMNLGTAKFEARSAQWWRFGILSKGGWLDHEREGWVFKAKPGSSSVEGLAPLTFDSLVIVGVELKVEKPKAVIYLISPINDQVLETISNQKNIAHELFIELEKELQKLDKQEGGTLPPDTPLPPPGDLPPIPPPPPKPVPPPPPPPPPPPGVR